MSCNKPYRISSFYKAVEGRRYKPGFRFRFKPGIDPLVRQTIMRVARWFEKRSPLKHQIRVFVVPNPVVMSELGEAFGVFCEPAKRTHYARITVAAQTPSPKSRYFKYIATNIIVTLLHELVHYEQWRDKGRCDERGVEQRAVALAKRASREMM